MGKGLESSSLVNQPLQRGSGEIYRTSVFYVEPVIFHFHRKPKRNLGFETELPVSTYLLKIHNFPDIRIEENSHINYKTAICKHNFGVKVAKKTVKIDHFWMSNGFVQM